MFSLWNGIVAPVLRTVFADDGTSVGGISTIAHHPIQTKSVGEI
jgi:hypothetical protein